MGYNLNEQKNDFAPIPEGRYTLRAESVEVTPHEKNNEKGEKIAVTYVITEGPYKNRKVWDNVFTPWALWKARAILDAGGSPVANSKNVSAEEIAAAIKGLEVSAFIEPRKGNNDNILINVGQYRSVTEDALPSFMK